MYSFTDSEILRLIKTEDKDEIEALCAKARTVRENNYGKKVYIRGLIEFTNFCKNDCFYCGIRCSNKNCKRYRLSPSEILDCCRTGDKLGIRTFVLQGGEDPYFTTERLAEIIGKIREEFPEHAITLSTGERPTADYEIFYRAGANRYLLRHETASAEHYAKLHPPCMSLSVRKQCLKDLKKIGYQTGAGFMVGTPFQTHECLLADVRFLEQLQPQMAGIGPFITQKDTPFAGQPNGSLELCIKMLAITRILLPKALIPAATAAGTISPNGRELILNAGANVLMPNLTPASKKKLYAIYDNKISNGEEAAENLSRLKETIINLGYVPDMGRGDAVL